MKNTVVATLLAISGFAISGFVLAAPVNAQTALIAALYQNPSAPQTEVRYENADISRNQIIIAVITDPEVVAVSDNLTFATVSNSYDRIITLNSVQNLACMISGKSSPNGSVTCGFIDHE